MEYYIAGKKNTGAKGSLVHSWRERMGVVTVENRTQVPLKMNRTTL